MTTSVDTAAAGVPAKVAAPMPLTSSANAAVSGTVRVRFRFDMTGCTPPVISPDQFCGALHSDPGLGIGRTHN
jgi:hypothetical protein